MTESQPVPTEIKVIPTKEVLEKFMQGFHGVISVIFDREKGEFVDFTKKPEPPKQNGN